jgi:hypothetical protein
MLSDYIFIAFSFGKTLLDFTFTIRLVFLWKIFSACDPCMRISLISFLLMPNVIQVLATFVRVILLTDSFPSDSWGDGHVNRSAQGTWGKAHRRHFLRLLIANSLERGNAFRSLCSKKQWRSLPIKKLTFSSLNSAVRWGVAVCLWAFKLIYIAFLAIVVTILPGKLPGHRLLKKFPAFFWNRRLITTFTSFRLLSLF